MKKYDTAIFSIDKIIADSKNILREVSIDFFKENKISLPIDYDKKVKNMNMEEMAIYARGACGIDMDIKELNDRWGELLRGKYKEKIGLKNGVYEYIIFLRENNIKIGLVCPYNKEIYAKFLEKNNIYALFDAIVYEKGDSAYDICLNNIKGTKDNVVCFYNNMAQLDIIKNIGSCILVYDKYINDDIEIMLERSDEYITDFREFII